MQTKCFDHELLAKKMKKLESHPVYQSVSDLGALKCFMETHVVAVWDFMSLLKALQMRLTCVSVPWTPSFPSKQMARLINEIVTGEESDLDLNGRPCDHFSLYLQAMREVGADTSKMTDMISDLEKDANKTDLETVLKIVKNYLDGAELEFVSYHLNLAFNGKAHEIAASFFYGREKVIPLMFEPITNVLKESNLHCPGMIYYLDRHIELDGDEHSVMAKNCLELLCSHDEDKWRESSLVASKSLELRHKIWDSAQDRIVRTK